MIPEVKAIPTSLLASVVRRQNKLAGRPNARLAQVSSPLALVSVNNERKLIVSPWAALGTDALGIAVASALFLSTTNVWLRTLAAVGGTWAMAAGLKELSKLIEGPEKKIVLVEADAQGP